MKKGLITTFIIVGILVLALVIWAIVFGGGLQSVITAVITVRILADVRHELVALIAAVVHVLIQADVGRQCTGRQQAANQAQAQQDTQKLLFHVDTPFNYNVYHSVTYDLDFQADAWKNQDTSTLY